MGDRGEDGSAATDEDSSTWAEAGPDQRTAGPTTGELVLDGVALVCVTVALALPVGPTTRAWGDDRVVLASLLVLLAVALPHLVVVLAGAPGSGVPVEPEDPPRRQGLGPRAAVAVALGVLRTAALVVAVVPVLQLGARVTVRNLGQTWAYDREDGGVPGLAPGAAGVWGLLLLALALTLLPRGGERRTGASAWWRDLALLAGTAAVLSPSLQVLLPVVSERWRDPRASVTLAVPWARALDQLLVDGPTLALLLLLVVLRRPGAAAAYAVLGLTVPVAAVLVAVLPRGEPRLAVLPALGDTLTPTLVVLAATALAAASHCSGPTRSEAGASLATARVAGLVVLAGGVVDLGASAAFARALPGVTPTLVGSVQVVGGLVVVVCAGLTLALLRTPTRVRRLVGAAVLGLLGGAAVAAAVLAAVVADRVAHEQGYLAAEGGNTTYDLLRVARQAGLTLVGSVLLLRGRAPVLDVPTHDGDDDRAGDDPQALRSISATR